MRRYLGRIIGTLLGLTGGIFGVIVGFLVGFLFDNLFEHRRRGSRAESFMYTPEKLRLKPAQLEAWALCTLATKLCAGEGPPEGVQIKEIQRYLGRRFNVEPDKLHELIDVAALRPKAVQDDALIRQLLALGSQRSVWTEEVICWFYELAGIRKSGISSDERRWIRGVASRMGLPEDQLRGIEAEAPFLDAEAAKILGVPRSIDRKQLRAVYRRLASQFHPDTAATLEAEQRRYSEGAFVKIRDAYQRLMEQLEKLESE